MAQQFGKYSYLLSCTQSEVKVKLQPAAGYLSLTTNLETGGQMTCEDNSSLVLHVRVSVIPSTYK